jgi:hypothetical protein
VAAGNHTKRGDIMSILFSGDFHAGAANELSYINKKTLRNKFGWGLKKIN